MEIMDLERAKQGASPSVGRGLPADGPHAAAEAWQGEGSREQASQAVSTRGWLVLAWMILVLLTVRCWAVGYLPGSQRTLLGSMGQLKRAPVFELDVNSATAAQLQALPEVGKQLAKRIVDYRRTHGPFRTVEQLILVRGLGPTTLGRLESMVSVASRSRPEVE